MKNPEIRIYFANLLYELESKRLAGDVPLRDVKQYMGWTEAYKKEWSKYEAKIVPALQKAVGVSFYRPVIDVACAPFFRCRSTPLIMSFRFEPPVFVEVLQHELTHVLFTDNNKVSIIGDSPKLDLMKEWTKLFGKHPTTVLNHIGVHAMSEHIYLDVLKQPERLDAEIARIKKDKAVDYQKSWEYVKKTGYKKILNQLKEMYDGVPT